MTALINGRWLREKMENGIGLSIRILAIKKYNDLPVHSAQKTNVKMTQKNTDSMGYGSYHLGGEMILTIDEHFQSTNDLKDKCVYRTSMFP